ncbi:MAG: chromate efflux transporter, partial [Polyangiaceae bacterium]|nr:chromate efflux transporter [Polyangiaceae bacterium]
MSDAAPDRGGEGGAPAEAPRSTLHGLLEVAGAFLRLGCFSFGGPIAHLGYLHAEFVEKRRWLDDARYGDLVALCQFLPGPASSQVVFALGLQRAGALGALVASACFTLPSALLMIGFAYGVVRASNLADAGWLHGLKLAAVAVVAQALWGMGKKLCPDRARVSIGLGSAAMLLAAPGALAQLGVIAFGGVAGWRLYRDTIAVDPAPGDPTPARTTPARTTPARTTPARRHVAAGAALVAFLALLVTLPALASATGSRELTIFDSFYRSGALVFGGGHVVLPLLRAEVVPRGWL